LRKKPLGGYVSLYTNWRTAIAYRENHTPSLSAAGRRNDAV